MAFLREVLHLWLLCSGDLHESVGCWTGLDPVDGQEGFEFCGRWVVHELFKDPFKVGKGVCVVAADLLNEGQITRFCGKCRSASLGASGLGPFAAEPGRIPGKESGGAKSEI